MFSIRDIGLHRIGRETREKSVKFFRPFKDKLCPRRGVAPALTRAHSSQIGGIFPKNPNLSTKRQQGSLASMRMKSEEPVVEEPVPVTEEIAFVPSLQEAWTKNLTGEEWLRGDRTHDWYTGKQPIYGECPGVGADGMIRSMPTPNLDQVTRQGTRDYFDNTWTLYETMFAGLNGEESFFRPPTHGLRHPQIFYYGHAACLYINKLRVAGVLDGPVNEFMESILETGVDEMVWDDMHRFDDPWPTVAAVHEYKKNVYKIVCDVIDTHPGLEDCNGSKPVKVTMDHPLWALFMGFEHERIHLETSSVAFREMASNVVQIPKGWPATAPAPEVPKNIGALEGIDYPANQMLSVEGTTVDLGKPRDFPAFGWDNEYGARSVEVGDFQASKFMITNGEFWQFVNEGGYKTERFWSEKGWEWRKFRNMKHPFFWERDGPQGSNMYKLRTIFAVEDMQWAAPVVTNYFEARAYCAWKSEKDGLEGKPEAYRLLAEAEHHLIRPQAINSVAARQDPLNDRALVAGGQTFGDGSHGSNLNLHLGSESDVSSFPASESGHHDAMGNVWEWLEDHFAGLEGFEVHPIYDDFSSPCFDGAHNMIAGGSFISTGIEASTFARFSFRPHFLQHSGFRLVSSTHAAPAKYLSTCSNATSADGDGDGTDNVYESNELVDQYLGMHYQLLSGQQEGAPAILEHELAPHHALRFPQRVAELLKKLAPSSGRALDVGCAVGGTSFELATGFNEVVGFDFSKAFVNAAERMKTSDDVQFNLAMEAELSTNVTAKHEAHIDAAARARVRFQTGDACAMDPNELGGTFDGVVVANLVCRVPEPLKCLDGLAAVTNQGGVVILATPFSWLPQYTDKDKWLGGYLDSKGVPVHSKVTLEREMNARGFVKIHEEQMACLIREHQRKYQYIISEATAWRKN